jgi:hypothetical protein
MRKDSICYASRFERLARSKEVSRDPLQPLICSSKVSLGTSKLGVASRSKRLADATLAVFNWGQSLKPLAQIQTFLSLLIFFLFALPVAAQPTTPVLFTAQGDLWAWSEGAAIERWTQDGALSGVALAPTMTQVAYHTLAPVSRAGLGSLQVDGAIAEYDLPGDLALLDLTTRAITPLAMQSADATLAAGGSLVRSYPAWSPDGGAVAWIELPFLGTSAQLVAQNLSTGERVTVGGFELATPRAPQLRWGRGGFAVRLSTQANGEQLFGFYANDGARLPMLTVIPATDEFVQTYDWIQVGELDWLGVLFSSGRWALYDPITGVEQTTTGVPMLYSLSAPDAPALRFGVTADTGFFWETVSAQPQAASVAYPGTPGQVALSPDGGALAFIGYPEYGALGWARDGALQTVAGTGSTLPESIAATTVLWSAMGWRLG